MAYIETIPEDAAEGPLADIYADIVKKRGKLSEVLMIQSLNPKSIPQHTDLYMTIMFGKSPLRRAQREMIAVVVSVGNQCAYCIVHHSTALKHFWKNDERLASLQADFRTAELSEVDSLLCEYAEALTLHPGQVDGTYPNKLRAAGLEDRAILDAALVVSYFNFVNRMVMGLGVQLEETAGDGFHYE